MCKEYKPSYEEVPVSEATRDDTAALQASADAAPLYELTDETRETFQNILQGLHQAADNGALSIQFGGKVEGRDVALLGVTLGAGNFAPMFYVPLDWTFTLAKQVDLTTAGGGEVIEPDDPRRPEILKAARAESAARARDELFARILEGAHKAEGAAIN